MAEGGGMVGPVIETGRFLMSRIREEDTSERYLSWLRDPSSNPFIQSAREDMSMDDLRRYVREKSSDDGVIFLAIRERSSGEHIGNVKFEPVDRGRGEATVGIMIGDPTWRGRGAAGEVLEACGEWMHENLGIGTLCLGVDRRHPDALRAYLGCGFRESAALTEGCAWMRRRQSPALRLALGTAQFGMDYGISNRRGRVGVDEAERIMRKAWEAGIGTLDTAMAYGESESVLGTVGVEGWRVVTKLPSLDLGDDSLESSMVESLRGSLRRMGLRKLHGLLLHRPLQILEPEGERIVDGLRLCQSEGLVRKVGISIYGPRELDAVWPHFVPDLVQTPFNVLDRRVERSGWLGRMKDEGVEVHARSVFLQGLLLMPPEERPERFSPWEGILESWDSWLRESSLTPLRACLGFALSERRIDRVLVGVEDASQLREVLREANCPPASVPDDLFSDDEGLLDPSRW